jgi:hypothetical protein
MLNSRDVVTSVLELAGAVLVCVGVGAIYAPAGFIVSGLFLIALGWLAAR